MELLTAENPVFAAYAWYSTLLALKMFGLAVLKGITCIQKQVSCNPEVIDPKSELKLKFSDPDVERIRRAQLNDVKNNTVFWILGLLYVLTNPHFTIAINLFRAFFIARVMHTFAHEIVIISPPEKANLATVSESFVIMYMIFQGMINFC